MFNSFLDPTSVGPNPLFSREGTLDIRTSLSLQDTPPGGPDSLEPMPEDLVPIITDYEYGIGDVLNIRIFQLLGRNTETAVQVTIDETGNIIVPAVGKLHLEGLTRSEIEAEVVDQIVRKNLVLEPEVIVEPVVRRKLSYTVYGTVSQPNLYPLAQYDLRLLQAINIAGGFLDSVTEIFVTRDQTLPPPVSALGGRPTQRPEPQTKRAEPTTPESNNQTDTAPQTEPPSAIQPAAESPTTEEARRELINAMVDEPEAETHPATEEAGPAPLAPTPSQPRWIWYNDRWVETQPTDPTTHRAESHQATPPENLERAGAEPISRPTIDWNEVAGEQEQRVIKISADALRNGDPRHNIVVRSGDIIRLASGEFGEYYMTGQVTRPGAYSLTGRNITLKAAISAAGDFGPLAWPSNCTIFRRYGDREEMRQVNLDAIFAGREQDLFVRKDDLILVGTTPVAPFLAVLRNSFRASYGFGFVYDRNFADIDSFSSQPNPAFRQRRFPNLFPEQQ